ncbi:D-amino-acid transaminase [Aureimonas jatrophae]|uniref:Probable branched-chain-amino-acid aminotransferase n=1 Tax=Aureimonas jatrophae TaxID=1166073 RepID=A0A1H0CYC3_9HYPH|nr:D-amino-acid transaminase [Aureimonas jatrophae]MBB3949411.1 D-alanine transaminase [Aureimonas jatrophae]SDN62895.1 D-alanine transaminase [Aureimonas jatrophae]
MSRTVFVNGEFVPEADARISVFDRGFLFADAVYEVTAVIGGKLVDYAAHQARLRRSLAELDMASPAGDDELLALHRELVRRNGIDLGSVYLQVSRGAADRDFIWPPAETGPGLVLFTQTRASLESPEAERGLRVAVAPDLRWGRRDIKTTQLLYASMAKSQARRDGFDDVWMTENGFVTEGSSNNAYILTQDGTIVTPSLSRSILPGITRSAVLHGAAEAGLAIEERPFTVEEAQGAREAFITSAGAFVTAVVEIDGVRVGDGRPGDLARRLRRVYLDEAMRTAI